MGECKQTTCLDHAGNCCIDWCRECQTCEANARALAEPDCGNYPYDMNEWFELSYAQYLTVPRVVMENMPLEWQQQMVRLLREMDDTFDWRPKEGRYWIRLRDRNGRFAEAPLGEYRHRNVEHLRWTEQWTTTSRRKERS